MELEFAGTDEIHSVQGKLLTAQVTRMYNNSTFMRDKLRSYGIHPGDIKGIEDLTALPFTTKQELHQNEWKLLSVPSTKIAEVVSTSGTTGKLFYVPLTISDLELLAYGEKLAFQSAGITSGDKCQITVTLDKFFMAGMAYYLGAQQVGATVYRVGPGNLEQQIQVADTLETTVIVGVPSFIIKLLELGQFSNLRKLVLVGETILNRDLELNGLGQRIKALTQAELFSSLGITEIGCSFTECIAHNGLHARTGQVIAEVLDSEGNNVGVGEIGELVVTTLKMEAMPLIRYKTGDLVVRLPDQPCACGRRGMRIGPVIARKDQMIKLKGTTIYPSQIQQVLFNWPEVINYQIVVNSSWDGLDKVLLKVGVLKDAENLLQGLRKAFRSHIRVVPDIVIGTPEEVERSLTIAGSRKAKIFYDCRAKVGC